MSKLNVDQKSILDLLGDRKNKFLIPDYQRPYAWTEDQCRTLWDDVYSFSLPDNNKDLFSSSDEYFLGSIVTFKNSDNQLEVIDGQQRLTTIMLLFRAFYDAFKWANDDNSKKIRNDLGRCIWKTDEFGNLLLDQLKIDSEVATDNDKEEFINILRTGEVDTKSRSRYAANYRFFVKQVSEFQKYNTPSFMYLPRRIMDNCILLPIEAESQDTALRIFSTLNDRGLPLSDADIFKAQFYKFYSDLGGKAAKDKFIDEWKDLEALVNPIFHPLNGTPMDDLFTRYMYYLRAKEGNKESTTESLRRFYSRDKFKYLHNEQTIVDMELLANFWNDVVKQNNNRFSARVLNLLFILHYAPNGLWQYLTSVYYLTNKNNNDELSDDDFYSFLRHSIGFIWAHAIVNPGVNALRTPAYAEMVNIVNGRFANFAAYKFDEYRVRSAIENYEFTNQRTVTRSMLTWYAFTFADQTLPRLDASFDIEHIYPRNRQKFEHGLSDDKLIDKLGNKILLESNINIKASDYRFEDKKKFYSGEMRRRGDKKPSIIAEISDLIQLPDFTEADIIARNNRMIDTFIEYLRREDLLR